MKKSFKILGSIFLMALAIFCGGGVMAMAVALEGGGNMASGDSSLTNNEPMADENYYTKEVDKRITKIRPLTTPLDTLSRHTAHKISTKSLEVQYYSVGTQPIKTKLLKAVVAQTAGLTTAIEVADSEMFSPCDTIRVVDVKGYEKDGVTKEARDLILYVTGADSSGNPTVMAVNGTKNSAGNNIYLPDIPANTILIRMGKACAEKDATAPTYSIVPTKKITYCQNFMAQIEESTFEKMSGKEVDWAFSDREEAVLFDMKLGMELSYWYGIGNKFTHPVKKEIVSTCNGIIWEAGKDIIMGTYDAEKQECVVTSNDMVDVAEMLFTGVGAGSKSKVLFAGSKLLTAMQKARTDKYMLEQPDIEKYDLSFRGWNTNFGKTLIIHNEIFDMNGEDDCGVFLDVEFLNKATFIPFGRNVLDLKSAGIKNSNAVVLQEVSCLYLTSPQSHARVRLARV